MSKRRNNNRGKEAPSVNPMGISPGKERMDDPVSQGEEKAKKDNTER
ncbi:small, acid-soluble spore protein L [Bacillus marinisedimentorum]|nr:small, acid-soluble spore protein L [Bacillus marinisedimentorum]